MKRVIVCDSGLGGLNIAAHFFRNRQAEPCELLFYNAYPAAGHGFNTLPDDRAKEDLLREVLRSMEKFSPDLCLIACNTLSIVYQSLRQRFQPTFPVEVIIDAAAAGMAEALQQDTAASLLILGTATTVNSNLYRERLRQSGADPERIYALACPGLATLLENNPLDPEIRRRIRAYAVEAASLFNHPPVRLLLALCCTHYEYAGEAWREIFTEVFQRPVGVINPNERMRAGFSAKEFRYLSRRGFEPGAREQMVHYYGSRVPEIAAALAAAQPDPELFPFREK